MCSRFDRYHKHNLQKSANVVHISHLVCLHKDETDDVFPSTGFSQNSHGSCKSHNWAGVAPQCGAHGYNVRMHINIHTRTQKQHQCLAETRKETQDMSTTFTLLASRTHTKAHDTVFILHLQILHQVLLNGKAVHVVVGLTLQSTKNDLSCAWEWRGSETLARM